jgi:hypothetical protein
MEKEFIPYEQALALKELGFDEPCLAFYDGKGDSTIYYNSLRDGSGDYKPFKATERLKWFGAPLYQQAFRWFREKCGLWQIVMQNTDKDWTYDIMTIIGMVDYKIFDVFDTYEEAEQACLIKLIEIVKNK